MQEMVYLLRVPQQPALLALIVRALSLAENPQWLRVATLAPLSNFGYLENHEGHIISWTAEGIGMGVPDDLSVPRSFIPWQNIAYVAEGDLIRDFSEFRMLTGKGNASLLEYYNQPA